MHIHTKAIAVLAACLTGFGATAQDFEPTSTWPYIYEDFADGKLMMNTGKVVEGKYNICLSNSSVHFIEGDLVKQASAVEVTSVQIGQDIYVNAAGQMMKVVAKSDKGVVAEGCSIDLARLNETGGAYGSSSSSNATTALSSLEGIGGTRSNMNHMELKASKSDGKTLPLITKYYLVYGGKVIFAGKRDVEEGSGVDKAELKSFLKSNKIKWRKPESLIVLVNFLAEKQ